MIPMLQRVERLRPMDYPVGLGHLIDPDPLQIPPGYSLRTWDVNLDTTGGVTKRGGIEYIAENGACGVQIATCQEGDWDAGSATDATAGRFRRYKYSLLGTSSRKVTAAGAGLYSSKRSINPHLDLATDADEYICWWSYIEDVTKVTDVAVVISSGEQDFMALEEHVVVAPGGFSGAAGNGSFTYRVPAAQLVNGFNFFSIRKSAFVKAGLPVWTDITSVTIELMASAATAVNFDNIWLGPAHLYGLFNFRRSAAKGGGNWYLAAGRGQIDVFVPEQFRWQPLITGLTRGEVVNFFTINDSCYAVKKSDPVKLIIDNQTAYDAGIVAPAVAPTVNQVAGGSIAKGTHEVAVVFYSDITKRESAPVFTGPVVVGADGTKFDYTNLPVSADPKVTHLRIYRFAPGRPGYKRVSAELLGEVENSQLTYSEGTATTSLGALLEGSPNYDINLPPGRARVAAVVANHVIYDDPENPGRLRVSRSGTGEQVPLDGSIPLDEGDNDDISSIFNADGIAVAFKRNSFYVGPKVGGGLQPFDFVRKSEKIGTLSHRSVIASDGLVRFRHATGYYAMGYDWNPRKIGAGWDKPSKMPLAEPSLQTFNNARAELVTSAYLTHRDQILWTETRRKDRFPSVQPVLHEDLNNPAGGLQSGWAFHRAPVSIVAQAIDQAFDEIVLGGGAAGIVFRLDSSRSHDQLVQGKVAIDMDYMDPPRDRAEKALGIGPRVLKTYKYLDMLMRPGGNWPLQFEVFFDWLPRDGAAGTLQPDERAGDAIGVTFAIGKSAIGGRGGSYQRGRLGIGRKSSAMVRLRNNAIDQAPYIGGYTLWVLPRRTGSSRY